MVELRKMGQFVTYYIVAQFGRKKDIHIRQADNPVSVTLAEYSRAGGYFPPRRVAAETGGKLARTGHEYEGSGTACDGFHGIGYAEGSIVVVETYVAAEGYHSAAPGGVMRQDYAVGMNALRSDGDVKSVE